MTRVPIVPIACIFVFTILTGLSCGVEENGRRPATAESVSSTVTPTGAETDGPGDQSNSRISITNDEASLGTRVRITREDIQIDPATTTPGSSRPPRRYGYEILGARSDATAALPVVRLVSLRSAVGDAAFAGHGPLGDASPRAAAQPDSARRGAGSLLKGYIAA